LIEELRLECDAGRVSEGWDKLPELVSWLAPAAHRLGLTKYGTAIAMAEHLVAPTVLLLRPDLQRFIASPILDFGAGAGAVGLSLALLLPHMEVVLADRRQRVVEFLDVAAHRHGLGNCHARLVDLSHPPHGPGEAFATVLIRAFGPAQQALAEARPWIRPGATAVLWHQVGDVQSPDGLTALRTVATPVPSLALTICRRT